MNNGHNRPTMAICIREASSAINGLTVETFILLTGTGSVGPNG